MKRVIYSDQQAEKSADPFKYPNWVKPNQLFQLNQYAEDHRYVVVSSYDSDDNIVYTFMSKEQFKRMKAQTWNRNETFYSAVMEKDYSK